MNLRKRVFKDISVVVGVFLVLLLVISIVFSSLSSSVNYLINQGEPTYDAMNHMLEDIYMDDKILLQYLTADDFAMTLELDDLVGESDVRCKLISQNVQQLFDSGVIVDPEVIENYNRANIAHLEVEAIRNELIDLHKIALATNVDNSDAKLELLAAHKNKVSFALSEISTAISIMSSKNKELRGELVFQVKLFIMVIVLLVILLFLILGLKVRHLFKDILNPIGEIETSSSEFVGGKFNSRVSGTFELDEMKSLKENVNQVYSLIDSMSEDKKIKDQINSELLPQDLASILDLLKENKLSKTVVTIKDVKQKLEITHPTALSKLNDLVNRGYITIIKSGRDKNIELTEKGDYF